MTEYNGLTGLANLGNTCFLNSCMQIFSHTPEINKFLDKNNGSYKEKLSIRFNKKYAHDCKLLLEWDELRKLMWKENCTISPGKFLKTVQYIAKNKDNPFFLYIAHSMPHVPIYASEKFIGTSKRGLYGDVVQELDWTPLRPSCR